MTRIATGSVLASALLCAAVLAAATVPAAAAPSNDDSLACHGDPTATRGDGTSVAVDAAVFGDSLHGVLSCTDCHADLATAEFPHAEKLAPVDCSSCHGDVVAAYEAGIHAKAREAGSKAAATCVDCHGKHDIRAHTDPNMPYQLDNRPPDLREQMYFPEIIRGIGAVTAHFLRNLFFSRDPNPDILERPRGFGKSDNVTLYYPEEKAPYPPGYRGLHRLVPRPDGSPRCVACYMCATACPAQCIYIEVGEYPDDPVEKYPVKFVIDELRCVVCGFCVEACPKDAIRMDTGAEHAPPYWDRKSHYLDETKLLRGPPVSYQEDPWLRRPSPGIPAADLEAMRASAHQILINQKEACYEHLQSMYSNRDSIGNNVCLQWLHQTT